MDGGGERRSERALGAPRPDALDARDALRGVRVVYHSAPDGAVRAVAVRLQLRARGAPEPAAEEPVVGCDALRLAAPEALAQLGAGERWRCRPRAEGRDAPELGERDGRREKDRALYASMGSQSI